MGDNLSPVFIQKNHVVKKLYRKFSQNNLLIISKIKLNKLKIFPVIIVNVIKYQNSF